MSDNKEAASSGVSAARLCDHVYEQQVCEQCAKCGDLRGCIQPEASPSRLSEAVTQLIAMWRERAKTGKGPLGNDITVGGRLMYHACADELQVALEDVLTLLTDAAKETA